MAEESLIRIGFSQDRARQAVNATNGDFEAALTWLVSHPVPIEPARAQSAPEVRLVVSGRPAGAHPGIQSFIEKCRISEDQCSYDYDQRCCLRMCMFLWMSIFICGGTSMLIIGLFAPLPLGTNIALTVSGCVSIVLGVILIIIWLSLGCCCQQWWCWSCK